ncbi:MAG: DJ-1/PfpI family protein [Oscillospiraceae bacterium]|nr:DJ-1/PfpI family protein [Oscillospiraceae bacterium]
MVYLLLENGFEMCEALAPVDILRRGGVNVTTVGVSGKVIKSSHGVDVQADTVLGETDFSDIEMLIIPGGQPGVDNLWENEDIKKLVRSVAEREIRISAICAAPMILSRLGLLDGKKCTCYPSCREELPDEGFDEKAGVVRDGGIITGRAAGDAYAFAFEILSVLRGEEIAESVKNAICYR